MEIQKVFTQILLYNSLVCAFFSFSALKHLIESGKQAYGSSVSSTISCWFSHVSAIIVKEEDAAIYTIKAVDDPRTLDKILYMAPPANVLSFNEVIALWEKKIGKKLEKIYIPEDRLLKTIKGDWIFLQKQDKMHCSKT